MISPRKIGVGNGNRTRNRRSHSPVLCQLSYSHRKKTIIATAIADVRSGKKVVSCSGLTISHPQESEERRSLVPLIKARGFGMTPRARYQKLTRTPSCAAKGMPTVVPGPKKSPRPPAGIANCCRRVIGFVGEPGGVGPGEGGFPASGDGPRGGPRQGKARPARPSTG